MKANLITKELFHREIKQACTTGKCFVKRRKPKEGKFLLCNCVYQNEWRRSIPFSSCLQSNHAKQNVLLRARTVVSQNFGSSEEREDAMSAFEPIYLTHKPYSLQCTTHNFGSENKILAMDPIRNYS